MANHHQQRTTDNLQLEQESPISRLPEDLITAIISCTTPRDACCLSLVSFFKSAAESDVVWGRFLPPLLQGLPSKKQLFRCLLDHPILFDYGKKSISLDRRSVKICCMISSKDLYLSWGDLSTNWTWPSSRGPRFRQVAKLIGVCWFENQPVEASVGLVGTKKRTQSVYLDEETSQENNWSPEFLRLGYRSQKAKRQRSFAREERGYDWRKVELGDFYNAGDENGELEMSILEKSCDWKRGLIIQGIEIRPKEG